MRGPHSVSTLPVLCSSKTTLVAESQAQKKSPSVRADVRTSWPSYCPVLQHFVESFADLGEVGPEGPAGVVQFGQQLRVGVMVEHVVDAAVGLGGEVGVDQLEEHVPAAGQELLHHLLVEGEVHLRVGDDGQVIRFALVSKAKRDNVCGFRQRVYELIEDDSKRADWAAVALYLVEADGRHGPVVQLLLELLRHLQLLHAEAVVPEQHADLHRDLDQVLDDFLGLRLVAGVALGDVVELVQDLAGGVVDEHLDGRPGGHAAEDLLLRPHGQVLGAEAFHGWA